MGLTVKWLRVQLQLKELRLVLSIIQVNIVVSTLLFQCTMIDRGISIIPTLKNNINQETRISFGDCVTLLHPL